MRTKTLSGLAALNVVFLILSPSSNGPSTYLIGVKAAVEKNPHYVPGSSAGLNREKPFCQKNSMAIAVNY